MYVLYQADRGVQKRHVGIMLGTASGNSIDIHYTCSLSIAIGINCIWQWIGLDHRPPFFLVLQSLKPLRMTVDFQRHGHQNIGSNLVFGINS